MLYPQIRLSELVGTDLVQAVPLVASAAVGHLLFGDFKLGLTTSILIGSIPGVFLGARYSSRAPDHVVRPSLAVVLLASGLKLVGVSNLVLAVVIPLAMAVGVGYARRAAKRKAPAAGATPPAARDDGAAPAQVKRLLTERVVTPQP
jgi:hypothetical protein